MLSDGIILLHDNARPHTANLVRDRPTLQRFGWETLRHPLYNQDPSPCDFHIFGDLKKDIREYLFHSDEEVQERVRFRDGLKRDFSFTRETVKVRSQSR